MILNDPVEQIIADSLDLAGIPYRHAHQIAERHTQEDSDIKDSTQKLIDFYLPKSRVWIECKQFYTPRSDHQLKAEENVILIQGRRAAQTFADMITKVHHPEIDQSRNR